jgi:tetratricopeptide (TPR) repeat protein
VRLFTTRAREAYPAVELDDGALADAAAICEELDGIPLAIELAAARVRLLGPSEIRARLAQDGVLGWPGGATAQRHRSLRAALDWSYELLSEGDRTTLRRLSVFAGSFTFEAAAAVAAPVAEPVPAVGALVDASLLVVERGAPTRYRLLDTVRAYARELLNRAGEADDAARMHALHYLEVAERAAAATFAPAEDVLLMQVDAEHDELRAALAWALGGGDLGLGLRLARALAWFWATHGHTLEGRGWLERSLALADDAPDELRADLLGGLGTMAYRLAEHAEAQGLLERASALASAAGASISQGRWLHNLAGAYRNAGDYARAQVSAAESLRVKRACGDVAGSAWTIGFLADTAQLLGELERAERLYQEGLELVHAAGDPPRLVVGYTASLAELALRRDRTQQAEELATEALERAERLGERWHIATANAILAEAARRRGALDLAEALAQTALREAWEIRELRVVPDTLELLAAVAADRGSFEHAAKLLGAASAMRTHAAPIPGALFSPAVDAARARAREQLGEELFRRQATAGEQLTGQQAVAIALDGS